MITNDTINNSKESLLLLTQDIIEHDTKPIANILLNMKYKDELDFCTIFGLKSCTGCKRAFKKCTDCIDSFLYTNYLNKFMKETDNQYGYN